MTLSLLKIVESTTVDGPGLRTTIYATGCSHRCPGCHNPQTWDIALGTPTDINQIADTILANPFENVTFSGGDPLYQAEAFALLAKTIKARSNKTIWCYTGYTIESIIDNPRYMPLLENIDVLVDGSYIDTLRDTTLLFRGSRNQRLIDIPATLTQHTIIEFNPLANINRLLNPLP